MTVHHPLRRPITILIVVLTIIGAAALTVGTHSGQAYSGSGSCSGGHCYFCSDVALYQYGDGAYLDRCAYGYFNGANAVSNSHPTGYLAMCAGMKTGSDGSGSNAGLGVTCATNSKKVIASGNATAGYATIINYDPTAVHYDFYGDVGY